MKCISFCLFIFGCTFLHFTILRCWMHGICTWTSIFIRHWQCDRWHFYIRSKHIIYEYISCCQSFCVYFGTIVQIFMWRFRCGFYRLSRFPFKFWFCFRLTLLIISLSPLKNNRIIFHSLEQIQNSTSILMRVFIYHIEKKHRKVSLFTLIASNDMKCKYRARLEK